MADLGQELDARMRMDRRHMCAVCRRPCQRAVVARVKRDWQVSVTCHRDVETGIFSSQELEDIGLAKIWWFRQERPPEPPQRLDINLTITLNIKEPQS